MYRKLLKRFKDECKSFINGCIVELEEFCEENSIVNHFIYEDFIDKVKKCQINFNVTCEEFYECGDYKMVLKSFGGRIIFTVERTNWEVKKTLTCDGSIVNVTMLTKLNDYLVLNVLENKVRYAS